MEVLNDREEIAAPIFSRTVFCFGSAHAPPSLLYIRGRGVSWTAFAILSALSTPLMASYVVYIWWYILQAEYCWQAGVCTGFGQGVGREDWATVEKLGGVHGCCLPTYGFWFAGNLTDVPSTSKGMGNQNITLWKGDKIIIKCHSRMATCWLVYIWKMWQKECDSSTLFFSFSLFHLKLKWISLTPCAGKTC